MAASTFRNALFCRTLIAVGVTAGLGGGACADPPAPHSDGVTAMATDTVITGRVKSQFVGEDRLKKSDISVTTVNGVVTLSGSASGPGAKATAESLARGVEGVTSVDDQLAIAAGDESVSARMDQATAKTGQVASDSWITTKVKSELMADSISKGFNLSVETTRGVVTLKGALASQDAIDHAKHISEKVQGVKRVNTSLLTIASM